MSKKQTEQEKLFEIVEKNFNKWYWDYSNSEDIKQEGFVSALEALNNIKWDFSKKRALIKANMKKVARLTKKDNTISIDLIDPIIDDYIDIEGDYIRQETLDNKDELWEIIEKELTVNELYVIVNKFKNNKTFNQIAEDLNVCINTVYSIRNSSMKKLKNVVDFDYFV